MKLKAKISAITLCAGLAINAFSAQAPKSPTSNPLSSEYRMGAEDVIESFVYKEPELTTTAVIRPDGMISLPLVGEIEATGRTTTELAAVITTKLLVFIADPVVNVIVKEVNSKKISVFGEVKKPDVYAIRQRMTIFAAIALAGGTTEFAKRDKVIVLREGPLGQERIKVNLEDLIKKGDAFYLQASDTVFVE